MTYFLPMKRFATHTALSLLLGSAAFTTTALMPVPVQARSMAKHQATFVRAEAGIQEYKLPNGLKILLVENHAAPVVSVNIVYRVGSRNEAVGYTGSTHFLEHMLFKGTPTFNKAKGTQIASTLQAQGARFNATTWLDRTNYFETLPASELDLALHLEADRMRNSFISDADRQSEMTVVRNELERGENNPGRVMWQTLFTQAFKAHPYRVPTIGWNSDVEGVPTERLKKFYEDFYYPNNATLIVVGDINPEQALRQISQRFGPIAPSPKPIPQVYTQEPPQQGERRFEIRRPGQLGIVNMGYHIPPMEHTDSAIFDVLDQLMSGGVSSRLHQALVEKGMAVSVSSWAAQLRDPGLFTVTSELTSDTEHKDAEKVMTEVIESFKSEPATAEALTRAKKKILADFAFRGHGTHELASELSEYEASADWRYRVSYPERIQQVTAADVQRVAQTYFKHHNRTVGYFIPEKVESVEFNRRNLTYPEGSKTPPKAAAKTEKTTVSRYRFGKEGRLFVLENPIDNTVAFRGNLYAGSIFDPKGKAGVAALTAEMLMRGTTKKNKVAFSNALDAMGSDLSLSASLERATVSGRSLKENLDKTLALMFEMLKMPAFSEAEFNKLKKQSIDRLKKRLENTDVLAQEALYDALYPKDHPHHLSTKDQLEQMESVTLADVTSFYDKHYVSNKMIFSVVGNVNGREIADPLRKQLNTLPRKVASPAFKIDDVPMQAKGKRVKTSKPEKANVSIAMGTQTPVKLLSKDYFAAMLANHALGQSSLSSRLGLKVRDELGLTYGIYSYFPDANTGSGPWLVSVTTNPKNVEKTINATKGVITQYVKEGISEDEFKRAKSAMIGSYLVRSTTNGQLARRLTDAAFYNLGDNYLTDRARRIQRVTRADVNTAIRKYFDPERLTVSVAGKLEN